MYYQELLYSETAVVNGINNAPTSLVQIQNLQLLKSFLSSLEEVLGVQIIVNSGYRCPELNEMINGSPRSLHMVGLAADIRVENSGKCTLEDLKALCKELRKTRLSEVVIHDSYVHIAIKKYC